MLLLKKEGLNYELKPESLDDLWVLSEIISPQDNVFSTTKRKVKIGNDKTKQVTKIIFVDLLVEKTKFENQILKISGKIQNETEFTSVGQFHTLNYSIGNIIKFKKNTPLALYQKKLLDRALDTKKGKYLLLLVDDSDIVVVEFNQFNFSVLFFKQGLNNKKYIKQDIKSVDEKFKLISPFLDKNYDSIIIAGPGFEKEKLKKLILEKRNINSITFQWYDVQSSSIPKLINKLSQSGVLEENILSEQEKYIELLLRNISKNEKFAYGYNKVVDAINSGSVEILLITTKFLEDFQEKENFFELNNLMITCENLKGKVVIIDSKNQPGKILDGLSGIGAILRY